MKVKWNVDFDTGTEFEVIRKLPPDKFGTVRYLLKDFYKKGKEQAVADFLLKEVVNDENKNT